MKKRILNVLLCVSMVAAMFVGCGSKESQGSTEEGKATEQDVEPEKKKIIMGGPQMFMDYIGFLPDVMADMGYEVEIQVFDDVVAPDNALAEGSIDANFYQHKPYLDAYNQSNGTDLVACEPYMIASFDCVISNKYTSLDEIPDGAKVAISDDPSNMSANLHSLEFLGFIKLKDIPEGSYYTLFDIEENPKNLEFVEVEMNTKYAILDDVDFAMAFYTNSSVEKYQCNVLKILDDDPVVAFPVVVAVDGKNKDAQWVKDLMTAMTGDEMIEVMKERNTPHKVWRLLFAGE